jgi:Superinfection immunity protein
MSTANSGKAAPARPPMGSGTKFAWFVASCGLCLVAYLLACWYAQGAFDDLVPGLPTDAVAGFVEDFAIMAVLVLLLAIYLVPTTIAVNRKHNNVAAIAVLNILLGWTFLGWVVALVWATTNNVRAAATEPQK